MDDEGRTPKQVAVESANLLRGVISWPAAWISSLRLRRTRIGLFMELEDTILKSCLVAIVAKHRLSIRKAERFNIQPAM